MVEIYREKQELLSRQYQQQKLPHAIIIQGIMGAGKGVLARWLLDLIICQQPQLTNGLNSESPILLACNKCKTCLLMKGNTYPDHLHLSSENKTLGVDDIRRGNSFLEKTAHLGACKTILIPQAQSMTVAGANALLKTLEEPTDNSFIILLTDDIDTLLPTIISRCAVYAIRPKVGEALLRELRNDNNDMLPSHPSYRNSSVDDNAFVNLSQLAELIDEKVMDEFIIFQDYFIDYLHSNKSESKLLNQLIDNKHGFRWLEKIICNLLRHNHLNKGSNEDDILKDISTISPQALYAIYQAIINSNKLIKSYIQSNRQFVAEQLIMMINNILKPST